MADYRAYRVNKSGRISRPPTIIDADSDEQAAELAAQILEGHDLELWHGARHVVTLKARTTAAVC